MEEQPSQLVKYDFYKLDPLWRRLPSNEKEEHRQEFLAVLDELSSEVSVLPYNLVGIRGDCEFFLWNVTWSISRSWRRACGAPTLENTWRYPPLPTWP